MLRRECVDYLARDSRPPLIILGNTSSPAAAALQTLGFDVPHFVGAMTYGEEATRHIGETYGEGGTPNKFLRFAWVPENDNNVAPTLDSAEADFVVARRLGCFHGATLTKSMGAFLEEADFDEVDAVLEGLLGAGPAPGLLQPGPQGSFGTEDCPELPGRRQTRGARALIQQATRQPIQGVPPRAGGRPDAARSPSLFPGGEQPPVASWAANNLPLAFSSLVRIRSAVTHLIREGDSRVDIERKRKNSPLPIQSSALR